MTMGDHGQVSSSSGGGGGGVQSTTTSPPSYRASTKYPYSQVTRGSGGQSASASTSKMLSGDYSIQRAGGPSPGGLMQPPTFALHHHLHQQQQQQQQYNNNQQHNMHHHYGVSQSLQETTELLLASPSDIGQVDLDLWDLDINASSVSPPSSNGAASNGPGSALSPAAVPPGRRSSDTSSTSGREDLSPPGSVNGVGGGSAGYSTDGYVGGGSDSKKKKGPVPRQQEELCLVCGDRASGYHYNALTCEGCKGFFRRSITKNAVYQCKYGNGCDIDMYMRRKCQECRLKKCLTVGMRPECVVPEYQCAVKREAKKAQKEKDRPSSSAMGSPDMKEQEVKAVSAPASVAPQHHHHQQVNHHHHQHSAHLHHQQQQQQMMMIHVTEEKPMSVGSVTSGSVGTPMSSLVKPLSPEQEELINRLVYFQEEFDQPSEEDLRKISSSGMHESESEAKFKHITEMTILTVQLTVEFSKRLPGFDTLLREDQITLLKACSSEVMMLRCARRYDANTDSIVFANNLPYTRDSYNVAGVGDNAEPLFHFGKQMSTMKVDNAEYALITAIVIFSERPGLVEARKVEKIQEIYLEALQAYVMNHRVRPMTEFAKLLSVLTELRTLGNLNSEMCFSLKLKNKKLPPFLAEIWDVHS